MSPAMIVPAIPQLSQDLNLTSENSKQLLVSIYVLSWCLGPLFWAPMSEAYGRVTLLNVGTTLFLIANLLCGLEWDGQRFLALRFFAGFVGSAGNAVSLSSGRCTLETDHLQVLLLLFDIKLHSFQTSRSISDT